MTRQRDKTAAYRLFHYKYEMRLPQSFLYGPAYLQKHGYHVSGDLRLDQARLMELTVVRQTPAGLAMLHNDGAPIDILDAQDIVAIYEDIQEHLRDWERLVNEGVHPSDVPPLNELRMFEAIASALYETSKFYEPDESYGDGIRDRLMAMNRRRSPLRAERYLRDKLTTDKGTLKPYVSIVDRIENELLRND